MNSNVNKSVLFLKIIREATIPELEITYFDAFNSLCPAITDYSLVILHVVLITVWEITPSLFKNYGY
jgi:hypothetical protein